jgi:hypothetical protein
MGNRRRKRSKQSEPPIKTGRNILQLAIRTASSLFFLLIDLYIKIIQIPVLKMDIPIKDMISTPAKILSGYLIRFLYSFLSKTVKNNPET